MRRLRIVLLLSLVGNLFGLGAIVGGIAVFWNRHTGVITPVARHGVAARPVFEAGASLSPTDQARYAAALQAASVATRPLSRDGIQARRAAALLFAAPVFDRATVAALLDRSRADDFALRKSLENAALDVAATMPAQERGVLSRGLARGGPLRHPQP